MNTGCDVYDATDSNGFKIEYLLFLLPLLGLGFPAYIWALVYICINIRLLTLRYVDFWIFLGILTLFFFKLVYSDILAVLTLFRYYFGFYIFYLYFRVKKADLNLEKLLNWLCVLILIEYILINTYIDPSLLPTFPKSMSKGVLDVTFLFGLKRPYSVGNNATITATIIVCILFYLQQLKFNFNYTFTNFTLYLSILALIALASGTGLFLLGLFLIYKLGLFKSTLNKFFAFSLFVFVYFFVFKTDLTNFKDFDKISGTYVEFVFNLKGNQINDVLNRCDEWYHYWIGIDFYDKESIVTWSDFAWNNLFECLGFVGVLITISFLVLKMNKYNYIPILIFILGAVHYGGMYSLPGQILLGYIIIKKYALKTLKNSPIV